MNAVGVPAPAGYIHSQSQPDNTVGQTKHWTQSRTVRAVAGLAVLALGALAGAVASFLSVSPFAAIIAAGAVAVVLGIAVIGYFYHHSGDASTATASKPPAVQTSASIQPPLYTPPSIPVQTAPYSPAVSTQPAYSFSGTQPHPAPMAPAFSPTLQPPQAYTPPAGPPPIYSSAGVSPPVVNTSGIAPPPSRSATVADSSGEILITAEDCIRIQEDNVTRLLEAYGYHFYQSSRDNNCFYDSISHQCPEIAPNARELRRQVAEYARNWQQLYPAADPTFSVLEASAHARLQNDVLYPDRGNIISSGLQEIETPGCFSDQVDAFFAAPVIRRPIVIIDINGNVTLAVNENGEVIDWTANFNRDLFPQNTVLLVHDGPHFMGKRRS
ncbi:OTU domain-containing protein [Endozoicomonas elysicola]|uniref:Uncharacterized protein n=1 Tax=Endozoicomonas elysicola TaxID=305900 RepID=A0A081KCB0_9GAMM|nr:OTU domain-containing protein [Endozoicomonas elysicola]KEI71786.1 hypothetical protein GV64_14495 [Endozoicomonas elysicola]